MRWMPLMVRIVWRELCIYMIHIIHTIHVNLKGKWIWIHTLVPRFPRLLLGDEVSWFHIRSWFLQDCLHLRRKTRATDGGGRVWRMMVTWSVEYVGNGGGDGWMSGWWRCKVVELRDSSKDGMGGVFWGGRGTSKRNVNDGATNEKKWRYGLWDSHRILWQDDDDERYKFTEVRWGWSESELRSKERIHSDTKWSNRIWFFVSRIQLSL